MIIDNFLLLWDAAALTATAVSTNTVDLGAAGLEKGTGEQMVLAVQVDVSADTASGNETYQFEIIQSANADLSSPDVLAYRAIDKASLVAGTIWYLPVPDGSITKRYIGARATLGGTTPSVTVTGFFQPKDMASLAVPNAHASGFSVL